MEVKYITEYQKHNPVHIIKNNISRIHCIISLDIDSLEKYMFEMEYEEHEIEEARNEYNTSKRLTNSGIGHMFKFLLKFEWFRDWLYKA
jgi:hypothetical protein